MEPFSILLGLCASQAFDVAKDVAKDIGEDFVGDKVKDFAISLKKRLKNDLSLPQTHVLLRQIRAAELAAARYLEQAYRTWLKPLPDYMKTNGQLDFANKLRDFLNDALKPNASGQISLRIPGQDQINPILDEMVAAVIAEAAPNGAPPTRQILETAFLAEIRAETGCKIPSDFQEFFTGAEPAANGGWYNIVALNISDAIANNEQFRALFFAADLAETRRLAAAASARAQRLLDEGIPSIRDDIANLTAVALEVQDDLKILIAGLKSVGFDPRLAQQVETERNKYKMTLDAVIKELGRVNSTTVDPENLINELSAVFTQYLSVKETLTRPANDSRAISGLKQRAVEALDAGDLEAAEELLRKILDDERRESEENRSNWLAGLQRQAESYEMLGRVALARRNVQEAIDKYKAGMNVLAPAQPETRWTYTIEAAYALQDFGDAAGNNDALIAAIGLYRAALKDAPRDRVPLDWAKTQNNLGNVLLTLGAREAGTARLEEAVAAYRAALQESTQDRVPLDWAMTQNNLGNALWTLGEREAGTARLEEAVAAYRAALREYTQDRAPLDWAATQNNLGVALRTLGARESGTARLEEAVAAFRAALQERTQDGVPLDWAMTQNNLGSALASLGEREAGTARLEESVAAYRAALQERTQDRVPLDWAATQNNLGTSLGMLGAREAGTARLEEAVAAYRAALLECTRDRVPLAWATTQNNLGNALCTLGEREAVTARLEEAVAAYREALQERTRDRVPPDWAMTQYNLANALAVLADRQKSAPQMAEALACMKNAVNGYTQCEDNYWLPIAQAGVTEIQYALDALQT